jgi:hypothetical protein
MSFLTGVNIPIPKVLSVPAEFVLHADMSRALSAPTVDVEMIRSLLQDARARSIPVDLNGLGYEMDRALVRLIDWLYEDPEDMNLLQQLKDVAEIARLSPLHASMADVQNRYYRMWQEVYPHYRATAEKGLPHARDWLDAFISLGETLGFAPPV